MPRGRSPTRSNSRSSSIDSSRSDDDEQSYQEENGMDFFSMASLVIVLKCVIFSIIATLSILLFTNYSDISQLVKEVHDGFLSQPQEKAQRPSPGQGNTPIINNDDAVIHTIHIPPQCHQSDRQKQEECKNILSEEMKEAFHQDGVIAFRGLLSSQEIESLDRSSMKLMGIDASKGLRTEEGPIKVTGASSVSGRQFFSTHHHAIFESELEGFRNVALKSLLPQMAAELMGMNESSSLQESSKDEESLRLIRDVFLAKDQDPYICGWHVDDTGFWPTTFDAKGINAWIAIDSIPISTGGGFALSVGSHKADWRQEAYELTGSTHTLPEGGYVDAEDMFSKRGVGTCNIKNASPGLNRKIEDAKRVYDVQRGDVILHTRWLFHRTVPIDRKRAKELDRNREKILYRRYSVRYSPGDAKLTEGFGTELSTLYNPSFGGKTLDYVNALDGPWYPKCWPNTDPSEIGAMNSIKEKLESAEIMRKERLKEMRPFLQEIGRSQRKKVLDNAKNQSGGSPKRQRGSGSTKIMEMKNKGEL